jgi:hypothetical protein
MVKFSREIGAAAFTRVVALREVLKFEVLLKIMGLTAFWTVIACIFYASTLLL